MSVTDAQSPHALPTRPYARIHLLRLTRRTTLLAAIAFLSGQAAPPSQPPPTHTAPSPELLRLQAENAQLRQQLHSLQSQLATRPASEPPSIRATSASSSPLPQATTTSKPAPRPFTSMPDILARLPQDLRPQPRPDWFTFNEIKFEQWWQDQLPGLTFEQLLPYQSASVQRTPNPTPGNEWTISFITVGSKSFSAMGADHHWSLDTFTLTGNDATAKYWLNLKRGTLLKIKGTIESADVRSLDAADKNHFHSYHIRIHLTNPQIITPGH